MRNGDNYVVGILSEKYTFQDAARAWRMNSQVLELILNYR